VTTASRGTCAPATIFLAIGALDEGARTRGRARGATK